MRHKPTKHSVLDYGQETLTLDVHIPEIWALFGLRADSASIHVFTT